jgi:N-acylneuraminate cytidylyltransferase
MSVVAIIPARVGSRGIPNKNFISVCHKPLIFYAIDSCLNLNDVIHTIDNIVVSTDSAIYHSDLKNHYGDKITVVPRGAEAASNSATSEEAILDCLDRIEYHTLVCFIQCTSPLTGWDDLLRLIREVKDRKKDSATFYTDDYGYYAELHDFNKMTGWLPRQERLPLKRIAGNAWCFRTFGFLKHQKRLFGDIGYVEIDKHKTLEIDDYTDVKIATALLEG